MFFGVFFCVLYNVNHWDTNNSFRKRSHLHIHYRSRVFFLRKEYFFEDNINIHDVLYPMFDYFYLMVDYVYRMVETAFDQFNFNLVTPKELARFIIDLFQDTVLTKQDFLRLTMMLMFLTVSYLPNLIRLSISLVFIASFLLRPL